MTDLTIIIVNYNTQELLRECFTSIEAAQEGLNLQIILVDNASSDDSVSFVRKNYPHVEIVEIKKNVGFGRANNRALDLVLAEYILLLNTDAFLSPNSLQSTLEYMHANKDCGVLGVKLVGREGDIQPSCRYFPTMVNIFLNSTGFDKIFTSIQMVDNKEMAIDIVSKCDWVPGCFYLTRKPIIDMVGLFDPRFFMYYEEVDHCLTVKQAGYEVHYFPDTSVVHLGGESAKKDGTLTKDGKQLNFLQVESELAFFRKNKGVVYTFTHVLLCSIAVLINLIKNLCRGQIGSGAYTLLTNLNLVWRIAWKTRLGSKGTR